MTENEWLTSKDPALMLAHLGVPLDLGLEIDTTAPRPRAATALELRLFVEACRTAGERRRAKWQYNLKDGRAVVRAARDWALKGDGMPNPSRARCAALLRDVVGDPYRPGPALGPVSRDVLLMAQEIHRGMRFRDLPVLADALEDGGCTDQEILAHLREKDAVHCRGCRVLRLVLSTP